MEAMELEELGDIQRTLHGYRSLEGKFLVALEGHILHGNPVEPSRLIAVQLLKEKLDIRFHDSGEAGRPSLVAVGAAQEGEIKEIIGIVDKISLVGGCRQVFDFYRLESEDQIDAVPRDRFLYLRSHFGVGHLCRHEFRLTFRLLALGSLDGSPESVFARGGLARRGNHDKLLEQHRRLEAVLFFNMGYIALDLHDSSATGGTEKSYYVTDLCHCSVRSIKIKKELESRITPLFPTLCFCRGD